MIYRQPTGLPWDARSIIFVQPSGELLLAREFGRGVDPFPPYPNGQTLEGGTEGWAIWDPNDIGGAAWVDAGRQAGMLEVAALDSFGRGFTGPYVAAPAVPAGAETYAYTAYGRPFQVDSLASVEDMIEARFGLFLSFANLPVEGPFILGGVATLAGETALVDSSLGVATPLIPRLEQAPPVNVPAGGFVTIPSPAPGFLRVISGGIRLTSLGATPNYDITLEPSGRFIAGRATTGGAATSNSLIFPAGGTSFIFGENETIKVANGGSAAATLTYWYSDTPAENRTLVRAEFAANPGNAIVELIPAAPAGFYNRFVVVARQTAATWAITAATHITNDDTAACTANCLLGAAVFGRVFSMAPGSSTATPDNAIATTVTTEPFSIQAQAPATDLVRRPIVFGCYETLPLP